MATAGKRMRVLIVEEQTLMRSGISMITLECDAEASITEATTISESVELIKRHPYDVLICDLNIHYEIVDLIDLLRRIRESLRILIYSGFDEHLYATLCIQAGADAFVSKKSSTEEFKAAWKAIISGRKHLSQRAQTLLLDQLNEHGTAKVGLALTKRELGILRLMKRFNSTAQIAEVMGLKQNTVNIHKQRIFAKLGMKNELEFYKRMQFYP